MALHKGKWHMFRGLKRTFERFKRFALDRQTARKLAGGIALGMIIGLIPKDSAFAYGFASIALMMPVSLFATLLSAISFSMASSQFDLIFDPVGYEILSAPMLHSIWQWLESFPISQWTRFNNSVVMGSMTVGVLAVLPVYWVTGWILSAFLKIVTPPQHDDSPSQPPFVTERER